MIVFLILTTAESRAKIWPLRLILAPSNFGVSVVDDSLFIVATIVCGCFCLSLFCCAVHSDISSFAIISLGKREHGCLKLPFNVM